MYQLDKEKFGAFVAQLRKEKGLTQRQLADRLMISDKAVSKWETGTTIPDTALLLPLAQLLGVTVTELLNGQRMEPDPLPPQQVEELVQAAITYPQAVPRPWQQKGPWGKLYLGAAALSSAVLLLLYRLGLLTPCLITNQILCLIFGTYFCFFVRLRLPDFYDQHQISGMADGIFRMNVPGLYFNNRNWPHIVRSGRVSLLVCMVVLPLLALGAGLLFPGLWAKAELGVFLTLLLGGLFVPIYFVGKKYQ